MDTTNIILWTFSIALAVLGIAFGIIASINSTKANKQIKDLVADQMVTQEASKFFYNVPYTINNANKNVLKKLKATTPITYQDYSLMAAKTRLAPLPSRVVRYLTDSEYADLAQHYVDSKVRLDKQFHGIVQDYDILVSPDNVDKQTAKSLIKYHEAIAVEQTAIMKEYYNITKK